MSKYKAGLLLGLGGNTSFNFDGHLNDLDLALLSRMDLPVMISLRW